MTTNLKYRRITKNELSFAGEKLVRGRHKVHPYPAMLHPLLVDYLIENYAKTNDVIFDPFCGSGVTLTESSIKGYSSYGFDINPLAVLIAKVKTQNYNITLLETEFSDFQKTVLTNKKVDIPEIKNIEYWYSPSVIRDLGIVRNVLLQKTYKYIDFFVVCFAYICRQQSLTRKGEFKRYRIREDKIALAENKVFSALFVHIKEMIGVFKDSDIPIVESHPMLANSEDTISKEIRFDLVITSPPYGDSRTTVAYGEFSSFGSEWIIGLNSMGAVDYKVDKESVGKAGKLNINLEDCELLRKVIAEIAIIDKKRSNDVLFFFNGYFNVLRNVIDNLNRGGRVCFVVGNRTVKNVNIPMDQITASFLERLGLNFSEIYVRDILNKVMPSKNSPSNVVGVKVQTMTNEYIVIFTK